jgi:hypothetical protein
MNNELIESDNLIRKPFEPQLLEEEKPDLEKRDIVNVRLNAEERAKLEQSKKTMRQPKDSTALKQLALIGYNVIHDPKTKDILDIIFNNSRRNLRTGLTEFEDS